MFSYYLLGLNLTALGIYKSLYGKGLKAYLFSKYSELERFIGEEVNIHRVSIQDEPQLAIDQLLENQKKLSSVGIIFASSDADVAFMEKYRERLINKFFLSIPHSNLIELVNNKFKLAKMLTEMGINTPNTQCVDQDNMNKIGREIRFPCLIKPIFSSEWKSEKMSKILGNKKVFVSNHYRDFCSLLKILLLFSPKLLIQEIIEVSEDGNYSFCCYSDSNGDILHSFVTQKLLQYPEKFGTALMCQVVKQPKVMEFGKKVIKNLRLNGISETEVVMDKETGELFVIEINTRHWMQHRLSTRLGVDYTLLDCYYRMGSIEKVHEILQQNQGGSQNVVWFDDVGYLIHIMKNIMRPNQIKMRQVFYNKWEFSLYSLEAWQPFMGYLWKKTIG